MEWLNYHHLHYFWVVAREGGLSHAARKLRISHSSIRSQLDQLEDMLGHKLFKREGRRLVLTDVGQVALKYADEIFGLGQEFLGVVKTQASPTELRLRLGLAHVVPKTLVHLVMEPAMADYPQAAVSFIEAQPESLFDQLIVHDLDAIILDSRAPQLPNVRIYHHKILKCGVSFLCPRKKFPKVGAKSFPQCLEEAPLLLPTQASAMRRVLDDWLGRRNLYPHTQHEFDDSALLKVFGEAGYGVFPVPSVVEAQAAKQFNARPIGRTEDLITFYIVTLERRIQHPLLQSLLRYQSVE